MAGQFGFASKMVMRVECKGCYHDGIANYKKRMFRMSAVYRTVLRGEECWLKSVARVGYCELSIWKWSVLIGTSSDCYC